MTPMKTTTMVMFGLLAALALAADAGATEVHPAPSGACEPVWIDNEGTPHVNPTCIGAAQPSDEAQHP